MAKLTCWKALILEALSDVDETPADIIASTFKSGENELMFYPGYGRPEGIPFTLWTHKRVYFPVQYDGSEWVTSVPRDPCEEVTSHVGGC